MMDFLLSYHQKKIGVHLPDEVPVVILKPPELIPIKDLALSLRNALTQEPFVNFLQKGDQVVVIVSDITRYSGAEVFLPILLNQANKIGIPDKDITIVFSLGIHRPMNQEEQIKVVGREVAQRVKMENHNAKAPDLVYLGKTSRGTPVIINRRVAEADKIILTGTIGYHYLAGFGGGRKSVVPGVAGFETCVANHLLVLNPDYPGKHPRARAGILQGNPMHEDMVEAAGMIPPKFLLNTILSPQYSILQLVVGDWENAFYQGCKIVDQFFRVPIESQADLVIVSCGGYPKDINFIQAHKTFDHAFNALKPGGVMILIAACTEGLGNPDFLNWFQFKELEVMEEALRSSFQINGQTAYSTLLKAKVGKIFLLSELPDEVVRTMGLTPVHSISEALTQAYRILGDKPNTYLIPYGGAVLPWWGNVA